MHLDLDLGKRHLAVFLGSIAALIVLALTPQLLGDRVAEGVAGLSDASAGWLWIAAPGVRRLDGDLGVRLAVGAHPLRRRDDAGRTPRRATAPARS